MVHTIDMPGALAGDNGPLDDSPTTSNLAKSLSYGGRSSSVNGSFHRRSSEQQSLSVSGRTSVEQPTPAGDLVPGGWPLTPATTSTAMLNGSIKEGVGGQDGSILSVPNGQSRAPSAKSLALSAKSRRSGNNLGYENERRSMELGKDAKGGMEERPLSASVLNGKPSGPMRPSMNRFAGGTNAEPIRSVSHGAVPMTLSSGLAPVEESTPNSKLQRGTFADDTLKPPGQTQPHRVSSPPAFNPNGSSADPTSQPYLARSSTLQPRNTLEVPKVYNRTSGDGMDPTFANADALTSGRFSPNTARRHTSLQLGRKATRSVHSDLHVDEVPQDQDAARWTEHIKAKRASKKQRVDTDEDRVVVGTKVDENHGNFVTAYNMLTGIRFCVSRTNAKLDRELTEADFKAKHKFSFDITGNELTPSAKYDFKFKDYAPWVFRHLRAMFKIDPAEYLMSLTAKYILSELGSPGKSGSFFYFSRDYKYIIKTIHHGEHKLLRKILKDYFKHVTDNPDTLLSQFYGLHRVKIPYGRKIHFVVMNNLFPPHRDIHRTFDLKGSTIGRDFKEDDLEKNPRATLKDLNWLRRNLHLEFGPTKKANFVEQMRRDVALLQRLKIMDYSLLVGIHDLERGNEEKLRDKTLQVFQPGVAKQVESTAVTKRPVRTPSKMENAKRAKELREMVKKERPIPMDQALDKMPDVAHNSEFYFYADDGGFRATHEDDSAGEEIYYLGIIDCLTRYNYVKKAEHFWKGMGGHEPQISPIPPDRYGDRFIKFISGTTMSREHVEKERVSSGLENYLDALAMEETTDDAGLAGTSEGLNPNGTEEVIEEAEVIAGKSRGHGSEYHDAPDRAITTVKSNDGLPSDQSTTLPVIGEAAESTNTSTHTPRVTPVPSRENMTRYSRDRVVVGGGGGGGGDKNKPVFPSLEETENRPPPTPPKIDDNVDTWNAGETGGRQSWGGGPPPTPPKESRGHHNTNNNNKLLEKELPTLPQSTPLFGGRGAENGSVEGHQKPGGGLWR